MKNLGSKKWLIAGGRIPLQSTGKEPDLLSQDKIAVLNTGNKKAGITINVFFGDRLVESSAVIVIPAQRIRKIRINDLIDPIPVPLEENYALEITSDRPLVIQFLQMNTASSEISITGTMAYHSKK